MLRQTLQINGEQCSNICIVCILEDIDQIAQDSLTGQCLTYPSGAISGGEMSGSHLTPISNTSPGKS